MTRDTPEDSGLFGAVVVSTTEPACGGRWLVVQSRRQSFGWKHCALIIAATNSSTTDKPGLIGCSPVVAQGVSRTYFWNNQSLVRRLQVRGGVSHVEESSLDGDAAVSTQIYPSRPARRELQCVRDQAVYTIGATSFVPVSTSSADVGADQIGEAKGCLYVKGARRLVTDGLGDLNQSLNARSPDTFCTQVVLT